MNIALWIVQGILAAMFIMAGIMKATQSKANLAKNLPWVNDYSATQVKLIGIAELLGGIGLLIPWGTGIAAFLTPLAALGLALIMVLAAIYHLSKKEYKGICINLFLMALMLFVAGGRFCS